MDQTKLDNLIEFMEESGASDEEIQEAIDSVDVKEGEDAPRKTEPLSDDMIRVQIMNEPDWRKRAALAALLASRNL